MLKDDPHFADTTFCNVTTKYSAVILNEDVSLACDFYWSKIHWCHFLSLHIIFGLYQNINKRFDFYEFLVVCENLNFPIVTLISSYRGETWFSKICKSLKMRF